MLSPEIDIDHVLYRDAELYWAGADQYMQPKFTDYPVSDEFYAEHLEQWWTYCDEASDDSFPTINVEV